MKHLKLIVRNKMMITPILFMLLFLGSQYKILWLDEIPYALGYYITKFISWLF
jgi:hypothetical protein